jgi:hypothetical protein
MSDSMRGRMARLRNHARTHARTHTHAFMRAHQRSARARTSSARRLDRTRRQTPRSARQGSQQRPAAAGGDGKAGARGHLLARQSSRLDDAGGTRDIKDEQRARTIGHGAHPHPCHGLQLPEHVHQMLRACRRRRGGGEHGHGWDDTPPTHPPHVPHLGRELALERLGAGRHAVLFEEGCMRTGAACVSRAANVATVVHSPRQGGGAPSHPR